MRVQPSATAAAFLARARVAHLATASAAAIPHVVPITFVWLDDQLWSALDAKPKRLAGTRLRRVQNLLANPRVAVVVDRYADDWARLGYVLIEGTARLVEDGELADVARAALRAKYAPYRDGPLRLTDEAALVSVVPTRIIEWGWLGVD